jgi:TnpA family transposase
VYNSYDTRREVGWRSNLTVHLSVWDGRSGYSARREEVLRLAASIRHGTVTASLIIRELASYPRQNSLHAALREIGRMEPSLFMLEWMQDPELRKRVQVGRPVGMPTTADGAAS